MNYLSRLLIDLTCIRIIYYLLGKKTTNSTITYTTIISLVLNIFVLKILIYSFISAKEFLLKSISVLISTYGVVYLVLSKIELNNYLLLPLVLLAINIALPYLLKDLTYQDYIECSIDSKLQQVFIDTGNFLEYEGIPVLITRNPKYQKGTIPYRYFGVGTTNITYGTFIDIKINTRLVKVFIIYDENICFNYIGNKKILRENNYV